MSASSVATGDGAPGPCSAWRAALAAWMRSAAARLVQQRGDFGPAGFIDRERHAAHVGLGPVEGAPPTGLARRFGDLREAAGDSLLREGCRQPRPLLLVEPRGHRRAVEVLKRPAARLGADELEAVELGAGRARGS